MDTNKDNNAREAILKKELMATYPYVKSFKYFVFNPNELSFRAIFMSKNKLIDIGIHKNDGYQINNFNDLIEIIRNNELIK